MCRPGDRSQSHSWSGVSFLGVKATSLEAQISTLGREAALRKPNIRTQLRYVAFPLDEWNPCTILGMGWGGSLRGWQAPFSCHALKESKATRLSIRPSIRLSIRLSVHHINMCRYAYICIEREMHIYTCMHTCMHSCSLFVLTKKQEHTDMHKFIHVAYLHVIPVIHSIHAIHVVHVIHVMHITHITNITRIRIIHRT